MKKNKYLIILYITSAILIVYALYLLFIWNIENKKNKNVQEDIIKNSEIDMVDVKDKYPYISTNINNLLAKNNETVGWLYVPNTDINYPVVKHQDNDFYLSHNYLMEENSAGWIFIDYRNNYNTLDSNTIIYGHNRLDNSMFGSLKNTLNKDWYLNNKFIYFNTINSFMTFEVFSVYKINKNDFISKTNFSSKEDFSVYLNLLIENSIYNFNVDVNSNDKIITLYTCSNNNEYRTILHAKLVQRKDL